MGKQKDARCEKCRTDGTLLLMQASSPFYTCANSTCSLHIPVSCAVAPMTRQMADDEVLRVLDEDVAGCGMLTPEDCVNCARLRSVRDYVAALQAERDALRAASIESAPQDGTLGPIGESPKTIADEMEAWSEKKMNANGSSRIDRTLVREWAKRLRGEA